ncbi:MAG: glycosyltransferase family 39 protein [Verrucomicrobiae bacterium]|nr:glycosyltransferase family 39 protein [Verrucomicrobiae bacterium]
MHLIIGFLRRNPWAIATLIFLALAGGTFVALKDAKKPWVVQAANAERAAIGKPPTHRSFREIWVWYGAAAAAVIFLGAGATARWWMRRAPAVRGCDPLFPNPTGVAVQRFGLLLTGITLAAAVPRVARMDLSFWTDEDWALCSYVWGKHVENADGTVTFQQTPWTDTLWFCKRANNHILYSVLSRASLTAYNFIHGHGPDRISEWAVRFPALVAGLGGIVVAGLLLRRFGHPVAGLIAACFLALHPQHIIYSSEARGYSLMIVLLLLTFWMGFAALEGRTRWRHWIGFAVLETLTLLSFTASVYVVALLNAAIVSVMWLRGGAMRDATSRVVLFRWLVVNAVAAGVYMTIALPDIVQTLYYLEHSKMFAWHMTVRDYQMLWAQVFTGQNYYLEMADNPREFAVSTIAGGRVVLCLMTVLLLASLVHLARRYGWKALLLISPVLAAVVGVIHNTAAGHAMLAPYLLPSLPPAGLCIALMLEDLGFYWFMGQDLEILRLRGLCKVCIPCVLVAAAYLGVFGRSIATLVSQPKENFREAVRVTRWGHEERYAKHSDTIVVSLWRSWEIYDPRLRYRVTTGEALMETVRSAQATGKRLFVVVGHLGLSREANPDFLEVVNDRELFEPLAPIWGRDLMTTLWPYELKTASAASAAVSLENSR